MPYTCDRRTIDLLAEAALESVVAVVVYKCNNIVAQWECAN